ncbi:hypothetical protein MASR2M78_04840 [Treponema sp.]
MADARRALLQVITRALANEIGAAARSYAIAQSELKESLAERRGEIEKGDQVMLGQTGASIKNPTESVRIFTALEKDLQNDLSKSSLLSSQIQAESEYIRQDERLVNLLKETQSDANRASAMLLETRSLLAQAQDRVRQAQSARFEADRRYDEARSALDRLNFDVARERVQRSGERYDFSLSIQDDPALRAERDQKLLTLSAEISKTENEVVVRDVRRLITEAKTSYFAGNFDRSEEALLQAQNRWKTTNVEDESEVAYWLTLVRSALAIKTGRTISPTAPLYSEMSQLLSTARRYFEEGGPS